MTSSPITFGVLTVSDSCFSSEKVDTAGPELCRAITSSSDRHRVARTRIVPDEIAAISDCLVQWTREGIDVILTTGGTGFSPRDVTPEATRAVIEREAPGLAGGILARSLDVTPMAMLSRAVSGIRGRSVIVNLPGSAKGAVECFDVVKGVLGHGVDVLVDCKGRVEEEHGVMRRGVVSKVTTSNVADRPRQSTYPMLSVSEALETIRQNTPTLNTTESIRIEHALNRIVAEDIINETEYIPPFDASIKDGYAVLSSHSGALRTVRTSTVAGDEPLSGLELQSGEAVRICTGAAIPAGADCVVQVEDTDVVTTYKGEEVVIRVERAPERGLDIRKRGSDLMPGVVVLEKGTRVKGPHIGVLATVGVSAIRVYRKSTVGIITTGNELRDHDVEDLKPGQIRDSNRLALINILKDYHYECRDYGIVRDDPASIKSAISKALTSNDVLITTGGVSMGEFDYIKRVLKGDFEADIHFGRVNMKPGKPTTFATLRLNSNEDDGGVKKVVFGLPGNPVSCCVTCLLFVIPMLRRLEGCVRWKLPEIPYTVVTTRESPDPRPEYQRVVLHFDEEGKVKAVPNGGQMSSRLNSLVGANGLLLNPGNMQPNVKYSTKILILNNFE